MEVRQLEVFLAVAEEQSFTRAAERLHLVQSAVSATIKSLENELGFTLFLRGPRTVELTSEGEGLLPAARGAVAALAEARDVAADYRGQVRGTVNLGVLATSDSAEIRQALRAFREAYPEVVVSARTSPTGTAGLIQGVMDGSLDVSIIVLPFPVPDEIEILHLFSGEYVFAAAETHPLVSNGRESGKPHAPADPSVLHGLDLLGMPRGFAMRRAQDDQLAVWGVRSEVRMELTDVSTLAQCIADGLGVGLLPHGAVDAHPQLAVLDIAGVTATWSVGLATRRGRRRSAALRLLMQALHDATTAPAPET
ncbi:LysR family transcriptional regulator [Microbacterium timonense]|uniref:LysR family transcriptional regulator n=1 Tax=Microbacterium timonense TaxID=2086576 RepID=UPI000D10CC2E|nr:LysR family transcriptional regulator [Microbacterium timonense]